VPNLRTPPNVATNSRFYAIADFHDAYQTAKFTPTQVVEALLPLIRRDVQTRSPHSTAFVDTKVEAVRAAAEASTRRWKEGKPLGVLDGVPFAIKDELDFEGYKRYCGTSHDYTEGRETQSSWCAEKIAEEGAVFIGKLSMHELGLGKDSMSLRATYQPRKESC
jgi:Asp-tRNA(Asn)/Glu-tRNA(Gln) amidotransferase A subunit family amidase